MSTLWKKFKNSNSPIHLLTIALAICIYLLLQNLSGVANFLREVFRVTSPLILAGVIAYILNPLVKLLERYPFGRMKRRHVAHVISVLLTIIITMLLLTLLVVAVVPQAASSIGTLFGNIEQYFETIKTFLTNLTASVDFIDLDVDALMGTWSDWFNTLTVLVMDNVESIINAAGSFGGGVVVFALGLVLSIYILLDKERLKRGWHRMIKAFFNERSYYRFRNVMRRADRIFSNYITYNLLESLLIGIINFIFMLIFNMPYPVLISTVIGITNLIPTFGPILGTIPCLLIILMGPQPIQALWFLIWVLALQLVDGNVIRPMLLGDSTGLRPLWVLAAIVVSGRMFGVIGMLLGVPVFAVISNLLDELINNRSKKKDLVDANVDAGNKNASGGSP